MRKRKAEGIEFSGMITVEMAYIAPAILSVLFLRSEEHTSELQSPHDS